MLGVLTTSLLALLVPLETPPPINNPVFALATVDAAGVTNMNILTYASPVGISPRRWMISLFRKSESHGNFCKRRTGVLQLLRPCHAPLVYKLGGCSSRDVDKAQACEELGFEWKQFEGHDELLLPDCAAYYRLTLEGDVLNAGEHDAALCVLDGVFADKMLKGTLLAMEDPLMCRERACIGKVSTAACCLAYFASEERRCNRCV